LQKIPVSSREEVNAAVQQARNDYPDALAAFCASHAIDLESQQHNYELVVIGDIWVTCDLEK
jgi:hypothetical protein